MEIIKYPIGIQTFADIINGGYKYVDKTQYVWQLVSRGKYYFLSRPRRFGKSLLVSTFEAFFKGKKDLFKGLYIADKEWDWCEYPVFHLALNGQDYKSVESLDETLNYFLSEWEKTYDIARNESFKSVSIRFANCIRRAYENTGRPVVILIDEYDQPLLQNIEQGKEELHNTLREHMQAFLAVIKAQDQYIRFAFLTGISKFSKVSVFSGLNNLNDISLDSETNAICGISESELSLNFQRSIENLAEAQDLTFESAKERLKKEYDGYHFSYKGEGVYNPFSLLNAFDKKSFKHYWTTTGTPSFLIKLLASRDWNLAELSGATVSETDLLGADRYLRNPISLLFQSGYLTIKGYDKRFNEYTLDYPNEEVAEGFTSDLFNFCVYKKESEVLIKTFVKYVESGDTEMFLKSIQTLLSDIPYDQILDKELHYENMMYLVMKLMGFYTHTEYRTSYGRIDMVIETNKYVYIIEFKLHGSAEEALAQIRDKEYALPFMNKGKQLLLIGGAFNERKRNLDNWIVESV